MGNNHIAQIRNVFDTTKNNTDSITIVTKILQLHSPILSETFPSPPGTDLRMYWGDACSLGWLLDVNRYFMLIIHKGTEYLVSFPTKTRVSPLVLFKQLVTLTGRKICYLHIDSAMEFQLEEIVEYCAENEIVVAITSCKPTMRVPLAVLSSAAERLCYMLASSPVPGMARPRISGSRGYSSERPNCLVSTAWSRMDYLVIVSLKTRKFTVTRQRQVLPCIWARMFSIAIKRKIKVQDFKSYPFQFPFKYASCLTCNTPAMLKQVSQMHADDADDDDLIAMETSDQVHIRAQLHAAENANKSHVWATDVCNDKPSEPVLDEADVNTLLQMILPPRATSDDDFAAACPFFECDQAGIDLHAHLANYSTLKISNALARHFVEVGLPKQYAPNQLVLGDQMRVVGAKTKKISTKKAVLIVKFISPPSLKEVQNNRT